MSDELCPGCPGDPNETCCKPELRVKVWMDKQKADMTEQKTEQKHTPGPWVVQSGIVADPRKYTPGIDSSSEDFTIILYGIKDEDDPCGIRGRTLVEQEANARLIAAAPELLDALQALIEADVYADGEGLVSIKHADTESAERALKLARAAIAKATGGPRHD